ncbi:hypothetical protein [Oceanirhabdus sp. W0125-5]|nr:hypothetical protein [Oceanirhabdus sp. W0125-5]WBW98887.1 hypothetical protein OW730_09130 [Oceanirhabdus sp. W0125-5]
MFKKDILIEKNDFIGLCGIKIRNKETEIVDKKINRKIVGAQLI